MARNVTSAIAAAATVAVLPQIPALQQFGSIGKAAAGAALAWFTRNMGGQLGAVAYGVGIGMAVDGIADFVIQSV